MRFPFGLRRFLSLLSVFRQHSIHCRQRMVAKNTLSQPANPRKSLPNQAFVADVKHCYAPMPTVLEALTAGTDAGREVLLSTKLPITRASSPEAK